MRNSTDRHRPARFPLLPGLLALAALLALPSCIQLSTFPDGGTPGTAPSGGPSQTADPLLAQGAEAFRKGDYAGAARAYSAFLDRNPSSPATQDALFGAGVSSELARDYDSAYRRYTALASGYPDGVRTLEARQRIPQVLVSLGRPQEALEAARANLERASGAGARELAPQKLSEGNALWLLGRYPAAAESYAAALASDSPEVKGAAQRGLNASFRNLSQDELGQFAKRYGQNSPGPEAVWFMAYQSAMAGDSTTLAAQAQYFRTYFPSHPWGERLSALEAAAGQSPPPPPDADFDPKAWTPSVLSAPLAGVAAAAVGGPGTGSLVAAILPLSGDNNSRFAVEVLEGLRLAAAASGGAVSILEMDTGGVPASAVRLVNQAAADPRVVAVVGPLASPEALAAAQTAQQVGMPLIAVSQRLGLVNGRSLVFRIFFTPKHQAEAAASYAVQELKASSLGIMYPDDVYGQAMLGFFSEEATRRGATVTVREAYSLAAGNLQQAVDRATGAGAVRQASSSYQAPVGFSALYLPDSAPAVAQILPLLAYNDLTRMTFLGSPLWVTPDLPANSGRYLKGCVIPVPFTILSARPQAQAFVQAFRAAHQRDPGQFAAYGYDAGLAVISAVSAGATGHGDLARHLSTMPPVQGATGPFSFDAEGEYTVRPAYLTVDDNAFKLLRDAGE
ncbi:MAG: ABC transporter substrate-binding protein [Deltaproteobacteria bacterium]|jgi:ABC-type branched-subunit amino acid transport system substrate-binding protein/tetratricopeptide (TPR) repeat protein|nr:ABC transporter substrate-binding protein [Deltaproteobacteria bacterium]